MNTRDRLAAVIIACVMCIPFLGIGFWRLRAGGSDLIFGAFFAFGGLWGLCFALAHAWERTPNIVYACLWSVFLLILGGPFLHSGIDHPEQIQGSLSITGSGADVLHKGASTLGGIVFILVGITCFGAIPLVWRGYIRRGLLKKSGQ